MTKLNQVARRLLADAGITASEWSAYGGWLTEFTDEAGRRQWVPGAEWCGDECGCTDDRCIGYHHDAGDECSCLPALITERAKAREAYDIWQDYRAAVEANDGRGEPNAYDAAWSRAETWVRCHHPRAMTFSLDAVVNGERGISATYLGTDPGYVGSTPEDNGQYRQQLWSAGTDPDGHVSPERAGTMFVDTTGRSDAASNYVAGLALRWARIDPLERWVNAAPSGGTTPLADTISEYLGNHNPFPDGTQVDVLCRESTDWETATVIERTAVDEWTVEFDDGVQFWRDHHELRPHVPTAD